MYSFVINKQELIVTGRNGVIASSDEEDLEIGNGEITIPITEVKLDFLNPTASLQIGDNLTGMIEYTLFDTPLVKD